MEHQHDELTDTGVIRLQVAQDLATAQFVSFFYSLVKPKPEPKDLLAGGAR
jgi:hypothetical protein